MTDETTETKGTGLRGIGVSPGVVMGPAFVVSQLMQVPEFAVGQDKQEHEIARLEEALIETRRQIRKIQRDLEVQTAMGDASILDAHLMVLDDRAFIEEVINLIRTEGLNVESCVLKVADRFAGVLSSVEDDYLRERVADVRDVARRIIRNLQGNLDSSLSDLRRDHIIVAADLAPSDTAALRKDVVRGFATDLGSPTSHTAVMARALEIPAVVALRDITKKAKTGDQIIIDGNKGVVILQPTEAQLEEYGRLADERRTILGELNGLQDQPAETTDGHRIMLSANTEGPEELDAIRQHGAEGIGLFRSEYLYLAKGKAVDEEEQTAVYHEVASRLAPHPVIIRTLDLGGDKYMEGSGPYREANPFLGCRSIRLSLLRPDGLRRQLRAILRASAAGNVKVMFPMISNVDEVVQAKVVLEEAKSELAAAGEEFDANIEVGVMMEVPSAALTADAIAKHVNFFSLGTNDLIQYTLAVDRTNERVAYLYQPTHPAVVQLIGNTIEAGHRNGIWVGLCGEMAADPLLTPLLVGLGVDELSVAPSAVPLVKDAVRSMSFDQARELAAAARALQSAAEIRELCRKLMRDVAPELLELV